jgi:eukaryotic-like serine/threonine-protein kinase
MQLSDAQALLSKIVKVHNLTPLSRGGQKVVFSGLHEEHGNVVVKLVLASQLDERIQREIEVSTTCRLPNTARIYETGAIEHSGDTVPYIVEEFIAGVTLRQELQAKGRLPIACVLNLIDTLLETAVAMERERIVHRDIKPENIMVCPDGSFKVLDFGIARHLAKTSITPTAAHFGPHTAGYAAPEQFRNLKKEIDIRTDLL